MKQRAPGDTITVEQAESTRSERSQALELVVLTSRSITIHPLHRGVLLIGRDAQADIRVSSNAISRRHARLLIDEAMHLEDCGSRNGTTVGGRAVEPGSLVPLKAGEVIELGQKITALVRHRPRVAEQDAWATGGHELQVLLPRVAASHIGVIVAGETGVGKEVVARGLHDASPRRHGPWIAINCAAFSESLLESELFGYERGAFTGATQSKRGLLELANGGTVFLDEIGEMRLDLQAKLLRVFEQREVLPLGAVKPRPLDVRVICATHRDLASEVQAKRFRQDLWFRLNGITLYVPPLRARRDEIPSLARELLAQAARSPGVTPPSLAEDAVAVLCAHPWPGNVRELKNVMERALLLCGGARISPEHLLFDAAPGCALDSAHAGASSFSAPLPANGSTSTERQRIIDALAAAGGNQSRAARMLGLSRGTLVARISEYGLVRPRGK